MGYLSLELLEKFQRLRIHLILFGEPEIEKDCIRRRQKHLDCFLS
jgi:hypothetical protein